MSRKKAFLDYFDREKADIIKANTKRFLALYDQWNNANPYGESLPDGTSIYRITLDTKYVDFSTLYNVMNKAYEEHHTVIHDTSKDQLIITDERLRAEFIELYGPKDEISRAKQIFLVENSKEEMLYSIIQNWANLGLSPMITIDHVDIEVAIEIMKYKTELFKLYYDLKCYKLKRADSDTCRITINNRLTNLKFNITYDYLELEHSFNLLRKRKDADERLMHFISSQYMKNEIDIN